MKRAYVIIGVKNTKTLPELEAVWDNVEDMRAWAVSQGANDEDIVVITDQQNRVTLTQIYDAVSLFCNRATIEQLLIYFSGHGVNNARSEYWLLSDAVENPNAAVNVSGSIEIARYGVIPHVVFISDACRTAASGIQAQSIVGGKIFPVKGSSAESRDIDVFYGTALGDESYEVKNVHESVAGFKAIYTEALLLALKGQRTEVLKRSIDQTKDFVHPRPLKEFLRKHVPIHLYELGIRDKTQRPDAIITSADDSYLSVLPVNLPTTTSESAASSPEAVTYAKDFLKQSDFAFDMTNRVFADWETNSMEVIRNEITRTADDTAERFETIEADKIDFINEVFQVFTPFGPDALPNQRGFKVRGTRIVDVFVVDADAQIKSNGSIVEMAADRRTIGNVLLVTASGHGVVVPSFAGFLASLTFVEDRLLDLSFVPDSSSGRFFAYNQRKEEIERLRAVIAASSRRGKFELERNDAKLATRMQLGKGVDPTLALYAAHAYREQGKRERLVKMAQFLKNDLGTCLFDVAMLASTPHESFPSQALSPIVPFAPLLSQSWPILQVMQYAFPGRLAEIERHVQKDSLWTIYTSEGVELIRNNIQNERIR